MVDGDTQHILELVGSWPLVRRGVEQARRLARCLCCIVLPHVRRHVFAGPFRLPRSRLELPMPVWILVSGCELVQFVVR